MKNQQSKKGISNSLMGFEGHQLKYYLNQLEDEQAEL